MTYDKPKVTIDLDEYNDLKNQIAEFEKEKDFDKPTDEDISLVFHYYNKLRYTGNLYDSEKNKKEINYALVKADLKVTILNDITKNYPIIQIRKIKS